MNTKQRLLHCACRTRQRADAYHKSHECDIHLVAPLVPLCMYISSSRVTASFGSGLESDPACLIALEKAFCSCTWFPHALSAIHIGSVSGWFTPLPKPSHPAKQHRDFLFDRRIGEQPLTLFSWQDLAKASHTLATGPRKGQSHHLLKLSQRFSVLRFS